MENKPINLLVEESKRNAKLDELIALAKAPDKKSHEFWAFNMAIGRVLLGWTLVEHKAYTNYDSDWAEWVWPDGKSLTETLNWSVSVDDALRLKELVLPNWYVANLGQTDSGDWHCELRRGHITSYDLVAFQTAQKPALAMVLSILEVLKKEEKK